LKNADALRSIIDVIQHEGKFTTWNFFLQSFISLWVKTALGMTAFTTLFAFVSGDHFSNNL